MAKAEKGTAKWLANKMKSKGLQRLRWYCQMCEKQCRDENGFKCHRMSESHQRNMKLFAGNSGKYIADYSREFEATFMRLMRTTYRKQRVRANTVYCDLIADKEHIHMNATQWTSLNQFCSYLEASNKCGMEMTERGPIIWFLDHEVIKKQDEERERQARATEREQQELERLRKLSEQEIAKSGPVKSQQELDEEHKLDRDAKGDKPLSFKSALTPKPETNNHQTSKNRDIAISSAFGGFDDSDDDTPRAPTTSIKSSSKPGKIDFLGIGMKTGLGK